eukprot:PhF_6_TR37619/c0_g1_i1/m.55915
MSDLPPNELHEALKFGDWAAPPNITIDFIRRTVTFNPAERSLTTIEEQGPAVMIGEGSRCIVYVTRSLVTQDEVAMKVYKCPDRSIPNEVRAHCVLRHEHIVPAISYERVGMEKG